jgi:hypothetical protein
MTGSVIDGEDVLQDTIIKAIEDRPAALAFGGPPIYFLRWDGGRSIGIRDFRYARYVADGPEFTRLA